VIDGVPRAPCFTVIATCAKPTTPFDRRSPSSAGVGGHSSRVAPTFVRPCVAFGSVTF